MWHAVYEKPNMVPGTHSGCSVITGFLLLIFFLSVYQGRKKHSISISKENILFLHSILGQELANLFCKGQILNSSGFADQTSLSPLLLFAAVAQNSHRQYRNE